MAKLLILFAFILTCLSHVSFTTSITTSSKDQTACTMCDSCENPCQPPSSPPPPPPVTICPPPPPPPSPPPPAGPQCPPPPKVQPCPPKPQPLTPDTGIIGGAYFPPPTNGDHTPLNPLVSYFPYAPPSVSSSSLTLRVESFIPAVCLFLTWLCCC